MSSIAETDRRTPSYRQLIEELKQTKIRHTRIKQERYGWFPIDDHGWVPWDEPVAFENLSNHPAGGCHGIRACGANFRTRSRGLNSCAQFITRPRVRGWIPNSYSPSSRSKATSGSMPFPPPVLAASCRSCRSGSI